VRPWAKEERHHLRELRHGHVQDRDGHGDNLRSIHYCLEKGDFHLYYVQFCVLG
jgi:hypothetical protein